MDTAPGLSLALDAFESGNVILEMVNGVGSWEAMPGPRHQRRLTEIWRSIGAVAGEHGCGFHAYVDMYIRFGETSFKRPDVAIYCDLLPDTDEAATVVPEAVVEILSKGYENKDLVIGVPFYLRHGVKDVIVLDPRTNEVKHFRQGEMLNLTSPVGIELACGWRVQI